MIGFDLKERAALLELIEIQQKAVAVEQALANVAVEQARTALEVLEELYQRLATRH